MIARINFGWLPEPRAYTTAEFSINPTDTFDRALEYVNNSGQVDSDGCFTRQSMTAYRIVRQQFSSCQQRISSRSTTNVKDSRLARRF